MGLFSNESRDMSFAGVSEGISIDGMNTYVEKLRIDLLQKTTDLLEEVSGIQTAIDKGWQGESRDKFLNQFESAIKATKRDLYEEYKDLLHKLGELAQNYFEQDKKMMDI